ncbi:glutamate--tRNA ligase [Oleidesulfovibrio sp.]|uniref:glutamate--tRNA ligase n=1 Tax=Oleidesulfovibrio sp. TaxID=2909707 RepID=UPI003A88B43E
MSKVVTRFAPSPTGHLHIGGARTAIFSWLLARHFGGEFVLRIEDTDLERSRQEYTDSILASMSWLGLDWDGEPVYQSQRFDLYNKYIDQLLEEGKAYWCECTPEEVEAMRETARANGLKPKYNGRCRERGLEAGEGRVVRLKAPLIGKTVFKDLVKGTIAFDNSELDDMIIRRADGSPTYNLAVVVDDATMGVTHVLRGDDHVNNTPKQVMLYEALGLPVPEFGHVPMILGPDRQKLSKRHGAKAVIDYKQTGLLPQALVNYLVRLGWSYGDQEIFGLQELIEKFSTDNLSRSAAGFDPEKLLWINAQYIKKTPDAELAELVRPFLAESGFDGVGAAFLAVAAGMYKERARDLIELAAAMQPVLCADADLPFDEKAVEKALGEEGRGHLAALREAFAACAEFDGHAAHEVLQKYVADKGLKFKAVGPPLRVALLGAMGGPDLSAVMGLLGKERTLARLDRAVAL